MEYTNYRYLCTSYCSLYGVVLKTPELVDYVEEFEEDEEEGDDFTIYVCKYIIRGTKLLHNLRGPAQIRELRDSDTSHRFRTQITYNIWGLLHNRNGAAKIIKDRTNNILDEAYYINGLLHRDKLPAHIMYNPFNGNVNFESYHNNNRLYREDNQAVMIYYSESRVIDEWYNIHDEFDIRDGKLNITYVGENRTFRYYQKNTQYACIIKRYTNSTLNRVEYYNEDGDLHRERGPAVIVYNGDREYVEYYRNGVFDPTFQYIYNHKPITLGDFIKKD